MSELNGKQKKTPKHEKEKEKVIFGDGGGGDGG